jgi:23S rRNA (guanosine2251-2'-O)-methyltransferase
MRILVQMTLSRDEFYQCDNPECRLRFPGYDGYPKNRRCPICRSTLHSVAYVSSDGETYSSIRIQEELKLDAMLDNIRSTWNVGSMFRTADGTGIRKLYLCGITPTPDNPKVRKTALGAELIIPWERSNNGVDLAASLKAHGYRLWALEDHPRAELLYEMHEETIFPPTVLIVGNEVCGVDPEIIDMCDKVISIPMLGKKRSYNVAVAFGMAASFILYRQRVSQESFNILPKS